MTEPLRIAVAGLGTVGGGVVRVLCERSDDLGRRAGRQILLSQICALDRAKRRAHDMAELKWAHSALDLAQSDADVIVELIGGENGTALDLIFAALNNGKHVVTANKSLLARHGADLAELAERKGVALKFEAAAAGGIPIVKALRESLIAHGVGAVRGILTAPAISS